MCLLAVIRFLETLMKLVSEIYYRSFRKFDKNVQQLVTTAAFCLFG